MAYQPRYAATIVDIDGQPHVGIRDESGLSLGFFCLTFPEWVALQIEGNRAMNAVVMAEAGRETAPHGPRNMAEAKTGKWKQEAADAQ
jgi:hypothetical protein